MNGTLVSAQTSLLLVVLTPLVAALIALFARDRVLAWVHGIAVPANLAPAIAVATLVGQQGPQRYAIGGWGAPLGIDLAADGTTAVLLLLTAVIAAGGSIYARFYPGPLEPAGRLGRPLFWPLWYFLWASLNALFVSSDIFNLYIALELITLAAVLLVAQTGERPVLTAALRYLLAALFGSLLYLLGVALLYGAVGVLDLALIAEQRPSGPSVWAAAALMTVGLLLKTALFPFHFWLPPAHSDAASPVSALLSGIVLKAWFYLQVRLWMGPFAELLETVQVGLLFGLLGSGAIVWGSLQAWCQQRLKLIIAYSTLAQIGYVFLFFPLFSAASATAWNGAFYHVIAHGCAKAASFLAVGNILYALQSDRIDDITGLGRHLRMSLSALALAGVSLIGLPPSGGFVAKWLLLQAAILGGMWHWVIVINVGSVLAAVYIFRILGAAMVAPADGPVSLRPVPKPLEVTALALAFVAILLGVVPAPILDLLAVGVPFDIAPAFDRVQAEGFWLPILILFGSSLTGIATFFVAEEQTRLRTVLNLFGAVLNLGLVTVLLVGVYHGYSYESRLPFFWGLDLVLRADPLSLQFLALSAGLWFLTTIYAIGYLENAPDRSRFFGFFSLAVMASTGIAFSGNLLTFLVFYEMLTLATYPLVVHRGTPRSLAAGRKYLIYTIGGGAALLLGTVWFHAIGGDLEFNPASRVAELGLEHPIALVVIFTLLISGLGVKAALVPLHGWLPSAMVAPAPVSALLHAVAVVKAGVFGIIRVLYDVFGIQSSADLGGTGVLATIAGATIIYGSLRALAQDEIKRRLAFSTVSQLSYIVLGAAIGGPLGTIGAIVHIVHQGLMKITLFFCAGNLAEVFGIHSVHEVDGIGRRMPWTMAAFTIAALGMIGLPPFAGFISKWYLAGGAIDDGAWWAIGVLVASSALNAAYFLPIVYAAWFRPLAHRAPPLRQAGAWLIAPPLITAALTIAAGLFAASIVSPLQWAEIIAERTYYGIAPTPVPPPEPSPDGGFLDSN